MLSKCLSSPHTCLVPKSNDGQILPPLIRILSAPFSFEADLGLRGGFLFAGPPLSLDLGSPTSAVPPFAGFCYLPVKRLFIALSKEGGNVWQFLFSFGFPSCFFPFGVCRFPHVEFE